MCQALDSLGNDSQPASTVRDRFVRLRGRVAASAVIPAHEHKNEAQPLVDKLRTARARSKTGPQPLSEILAIVLARLGVGALPLNPSEGSDLT